MLAPEHRVTEFARTNAWPIVQCICCDVSDASRSRIAHSRRLRLRGYRNIDPAHEPARRFEADGLGQPWLLCCGSQERYALARKGRPRLLRLKATQHPRAGGLERSPG